jgi:hypothetical protein
VYEFIEHLFKKAQSGAPQTGKRVRRMSDPKLDDEKYMAAMEQ